MKLPPLKELSIPFSVVSAFAFVTVVSEMSDNYSTFKLLFSMPLWIFPVFLVASGFFAIFMVFKIAG